MSPLNVVLFGETGSGKSSIINMLLGRQAADTSSRAKGCTFSWECYNVGIGGETYGVYDTAGLDEGEQGTIAADDAIVQLYKLLTKLEDGISLILFVMRGPRIKKSTCNNWRIFHDVLCEKKVRGGIVVTGLEQEERMDDWWPANKEYFHDYDINPFGVAGITTIRGKVKGGRYTFQEEYDESMLKVKKLIRDYAMLTPHHVDKIAWFADIILFGCFRVSTKDTAEIKRLADRCGMSYEEARQLAVKLRGSKRMGLFEWLLSSS